MKSIRVGSKYRNMLVDIDGEVISFQGGEALVSISQARILSRRSEYTILDKDGSHLSLHKNMPPQYDLKGITFSISIVCLNNLKATKRCLSNLFASSKKFNYEVLITDNGSDADTIEYLKTLQSERISLHLNSYNKGFMDPHLEALKRAKGRFFVVLNNDFYIQDEFWLEKVFTQFVVDSEVRVIGPITGTLNSDGSGRPSKGFDYDYIEGSCLVIPTEFAKEIGLFDNHLLSFAYCEDSDLSLRVRSLGYKIKQIRFPHIHEQGTTTREPNLYPLVRLIAKKNHFKFRLKWKSYLETRKFKPLPLGRLTYKMDKLYPFNKKKFLQAKKLLLAREVGIGDVLFFTTCCAWLKSQNKGLEITFATNYTHRRIVQSNPFIDKVISYESIKDLEVLGEYDYGLHFVPFFDSPKYKEDELNRHRIDLIRAYFGVNKSLWDYTLYYQITNLEEIWAESLLAGRDLGKGVVSIVLTTTDIKRDYPWNRALIDKFISEGYFVIIIDKHRTTLRSHPSILNISGQTTLGQTSALLNKSDLVITPDTGILHIAGALGKKIITFFNSFPSKTRVKYYKNCYAFDIWEDCSEEAERKPCLYSSDKQCPTKGCFIPLSPEVIFNKALELGIS